METYLKTRMDLSRPIIKIRRLYRCNALSLRHIKEWLITQPAIWLLSLFIWASPTSAQTTTWKGAFDNIKGMGESGSEVLNMFAVLIGSGMAIFGWVGLTSETKKQQRGVMGSIMLIVVGALLIVWRVVVKTNVGQIFGEGTDVPFLDN